MTHGSLTDELEAPSTGALFLPLIGSLLVTGAVAALLCQPPAQAHPWPALLALAAGYLAMAALAHAGAVWLVRRDHRAPEGRPLPQPRCTHGQPPQSHP